MHLGRYEDALERLKAPWTGNWQAGANWEVLQIAAEFFVHELGVAFQERNIAAAELALQRDDYAEALEHDLMCTQAWILKGAVDGSVGIDPFLSALCASATEPSQIQPALLAALMVRFQEDDPMTELVYRHVARHGEELIEMLRTIDPETSEHFAMWFASNQPQSDDLTIRYVSFGEADPEFVLKKGESASRS
jgi:hypothetical protein